ncbi:hypothetical protein [Streptosporangium sp. NPDC006007]|uniref:hypothetical protein n=1 Tax=Streptosporangium sp. NPDC006007 TaxID=3154575 RepID=UPI0033BCD0BD
MPVFLCLNELSCTSNAHEREINQAMAAFVELLRQCRRWRKDVSLISASPLATLDLAPGYPISQWMGSPRNRDRWRFLRLMQNKAPFSSVLSGTEGEVEYRLGESRTDGIGTAHLIDGLAVSLPLEERWNREWILPRRSALEETEDGLLRLRVEEVAVRHASAIEHLTVHEKWAKATGLADIRTGQALWDSRADFFPRLRFLGRVEEDLRTLHHYWLAPVKGLLLGLDASLNAWNTREFPEPDWHTRVTPESETRRRLCGFTDLDGTTRVFDLHARMTPNDGRLHFRLCREDGTAVIAYIGRKIQN